MKYFILVWVRGGGRGGGGIWSSPKKRLIDVSSYFEWIVCLFAVKNVVFAHTWFIFIRFMSNSYWFVHQLTFVSN